MKQGRGSTTKLTPYKIIEARGEIAKMTQQLKVAKGEIATLTQRVNSKYQKQLKM